MCYFTYWSIQHPFTLVSLHKIRWLFLAKALIVPPSWLALPVKKPKKVKFWRKSLLKAIHSTPHYPGNLVHFFIYIRWHRGHRRWDHPLRRKNTVDRYGTPVPLNSPPDTPTINELLLRAAMLIPHNNNPSFTSHQNLHRQIDGVELGDAPSSSTMALSLEPLGLQSRIQLCTGSSTGTLTE